MLRSKPIEKKHDNNLLMINPVYPLRVLLVEDLPRWQMAIQALLEMLPNIELVGCADNYDDAIRLWEGLPASKKPNLALLDFQILGDKSGLDVAMALTERHVKPEQIIMVSSSSPQTIGDHPYGYIPKYQAVETLPAAIEGVRHLLATQSAQSA